MAEKISRKYGISYLNLLPILKKYQSNQIFNDQCHLRAFGNEVVAEAISMWLKGRVRNPLRRVHK